MFSFRELLLQLCLIIFANWVSEFSISYFCFLLAMYHLLPFLTESSETSFHL